MLGKLLSSVARAVLPKSMQDLLLGPIGSKLFDGFKAMTQDGVETDAGDQVPTSDSEADKQLDRLEEIQAEAREFQVSMQIMNLQHSQAMEALKSIGRAG